MAYRFRTGKVFGFEEEFVQAKKRSGSGDSAPSSAILPVITDIFCARRSGGTFKFALHDYDQYRGLWRSSCETDFKGMLMQLP